MKIPDPVTALMMLNHAVPPAAASKPARDLTQGEARDMVVYYALNSQLDLEKPIAFGKDGNPTFPRVGEKVTLGLDIGAVHFAPDNKKAAGKKRTGPMDMRTAVLAVRLAQYLKSRWGVTTIFWGGMGFGRADTDRHGKGLAIDFHGAITRLGRIDVLDDWGKQPIVISNGETKARWPPATRPHFRLDVDTKAGGFFYDVYHWLTGEAVDALSKRTSIGDNSQILCPDTPDVMLREHHQDHIHCEIDR